MPCRGNIFGLGIMLVLSLLLGSAARQEKKETKPPPQQIIQSFPANDAMRTAWKIHWSTQTGHGLIIQEAWFKKGPNERWIQILGDSRIAEIFVPYHSGSPRFWDVSYNFDLCQVGKDEAGAFGKVLGDPPTVVQEVRDRGLVRYDHLGGRRGQELILFATLNAANYRYVVQYGFQDDGSITFRLGSSGRNYASREFEGHMHAGLWRVDINLDGPNHNSVFVMEHVEPDGQPPEKAKNVHRPFNKGKEGWEDWHAEKFTMLNVVNTKRKNKRGAPWSYDLVPLRMGNARHYGGDDEVCTHHDFWVTKAKPNETYYTRLPEYVKDAEPIMDTDVVLWHAAAGHHEPRSEDGEMKDGNLHGCTPIMWSGFDLKPRNFWDHSPMYP
jgi:primary-amine oxidase